MQAGPAAVTTRYAWVESAIGEGAEIVTANRRLARALRSAYDERQLLSGRESWRTPRILPWEAWLNQQFEQMAASATLPLRLDAQASTVLWERLLAEAAGERMLSPRGLVRQIRLVWRRLQDWCIPLATVERAASSEDERLFAVAARRYQAELTAHGWLDSAQLAAFVTERLANHELAAPRQVVHAGFDRLTPAARKLLRALADNGCVVAAAPVTSAAPVPVTLRAADADAELRTAGRWAREQLAANESARVAIVHPALEQDAPRAARLVREGLAPGWQHGSLRHRMAVNVSYGRRLAEYPLIAVALLWLEWLSRGLSSREVSTLLRAPLVATGGSDGCSRLELKLRRLPNRRWSTASLAAALREREPANDVLAFLGQVERIGTFRAEASQSAAPALWAAAIDRLLQELGWPGTRPLDSLEFQLVNRWRQLLNEWSRIAVVRPLLGLPEAIARLAALARDTIYQPETGEGQVQLLGMLEAAGLEFDHVWIAHLHSRQWPPSAHPLPFVSRALQRQAGMPDASTADTLEFSRRTLNRLVASSTSVVLSWPQADQESALTPSPLLEPYLAAAGTEWPDPGWHAASFCGRATTEHDIPDPPPPVVAGEEIHGGASAVQRQLDEPLSAFACGRLGIRELKSIEPGLSPSVRGNIIHRALDELYLELPTSAALQTWSADERQVRIDAAVHSALRRPLRHADGVLRRLLALERRRLQAMLASFLEAELRRLPFSVVGVETKLEYQSSGVHLELRVDRMDRLADGSLLIIDYKTGATKSLLDRHGEPLEVQLVVYACAVGGNIGGLALVNVDSRGISYKGTGGSVEWGALAPDVWDRQLQGWKNSVHRAMARIAAGDVRIDMTPSANRRRTFDVLSRIEELKRAP